MPDPITLHWHALFVSQDSRFHQNCHSNWSSVSIYLVWMNGLHTLKADHEIASSTR